MPRLTNLIMSGGVFCFYSELAECHKIVIICKFTKKSYFVCIKSLDLHIQKPHKMKNYKITNLQMRRTKQYGHYEIIGEVNGELINTITTDAEAFDFFNDDDEDLRWESRAHCEWKLVQAFNNQF